MPHSPQIFREGWSTPFSVARPRLLIRRLLVTKPKIGAHLNNYTMYNTYILLFCFRPMFPLTGTWLFFALIFFNHVCIQIRVQTRVIICTRLACAVVKPVKVPVQQRYCKLCDLGAVEDEDHFLLVCPAYQSVRERFRSSLPLTAITPLAELLSCQQQGILARFLVQCQTVRSELLHQT
jgi:hypothetical protein